jgi:hypothetical protein
VAWLIKRIINLRKGIVRRPSIIYFLSFHTYFHITRCLVNHHLVQIVNRFTVLNRLAVENVRSKCGHQIIKGV